MADLVSVNIDISGVDLDRFGRLTKAAITKYLDEQSDHLENYMKKNARWNDRTGNARRGLTAKVNEPDDNTVSINLLHSVDYGFYLEYAMELRFAILEPTSRLKGPDVIRGMQGLLSRRRFFTWL